MSGALGKYLSAVSLEGVIGRLIALASEQDSSGEIATDDLINSFIEGLPGGFRPGFQRKILELLDVAASARYIGRSGEKIFVDFDGFVFAERQQVADVDRFSAYEYPYPDVPAADRFVRLDDNGSERDAAVAALDELAERLELRAPNDLFASAEDRLAVLSEVRSFREQLKAPVIRAQTLANAVAANSAVRWLALAAAAGPIGEAATKALELLTRLVSLVLS